MDASTRLDHALFQLTPTRTRCDLVVSSGKGGPYEKIASGLLEPFLAHLQYAREQVPRGGYSFTLRPPSTATSASTTNAPTGKSAAAAAGGGGGDSAAAAAVPPPPWFTKGTLERFVRFVRTPEILERMVTIEREITQIESSIQLHSKDDSDSSSAPPIPAATVPNATAVAGTGQVEQGLTSSMPIADGNPKRSTAPSKLKVESNSHDGMQGENSKLRLLQVLETRRVVLLKEQAMAYARAAVAGFDLPHIDDLTSFADSFGASRLREACMNFKELCKRKEKDDIWMDELAAMETCSQSELLFFGASGITLTGEPVHGWTKAPIDATNGHLKLNGALSDATTNSITNAAGSDARQDGSGEPTSQGPFISASNDIAHGNPQVPMSWSHYPPQYMYSPNSSGVPYQGYAFPGMHFIPPYYPGQSENAQWPPLREESDHSIARDVDHFQDRDMALRSNNDKYKNGKVSRSTGSTLGSRDGNTGNDSSKSGSESDEHSHDGTSSGQEISRNGRRQKKRSSKKTSRTIVIRNINYISSKKRDGEKDDSSDGSSVDGEFIDGDFLKQKVENIVESLGKHHKSSRHEQKRKGDHNDRSIMHHPSDALDLTDEQDPVSNNFKGTKNDESWNAFQNILLRDETCSSEVDQKKGMVPVDGNERQVCAGDEYCIIKSPQLTLPTVHGWPPDTESEKGTRQRLLTTDPIAITGKDTSCEVKGCMENFECDENYCRSMKFSHNTDEELLFAEISRSENNTQDAISGYSNEPSVLKSQKGGDWFIVDKSKQLPSRDATVGYSIFEGDQISNFENHNEENKNDFQIDDSFVIPTRPVADELSFSQWETDMSIISGLAFAADAELQNFDHSTGNCRTPITYEPDDLQMVPERDSGVEPVGSSWTPQIDYGSEITYTNANESKSGVKKNDRIDENMAPSSKGAKNEGDSRIKHQSKDSKSKPLHGSLTKVKSEVLSRTGKPSIISREAIRKSKMEKEEENRRRMEELLIQRQKRIAQRSSSNSTIPATSKQNGAESKVATSSLKYEKKTSRSATQGTNRSTLQEIHTAGLTRDPHTSGQSKSNGLTPVKSTQPKRIGNKKNGAEANHPSKNRTALQEANNSENHISIPEQASTPDTKEVARKGFPSCPNDQTPYDSGLSNEGANDSTVCLQPLSLQIVGQSMQPASVKTENEYKRSPKESQLAHEEKKVGDLHVLEADGCISHPNSAPSISEDAHFPASSSITEGEVEPAVVDSTPPTAYDEMKCEASYSRKKWSSSGSPGTAEGIKKLLMFGH